MGTFFGITAVVLAALSLWLIAERRDFKVEVKHLTRLLDQANKRAQRAERALLELADEPSVMEITLYAGDEVRHESTPEGIASLLESLKANPNGYAKVAADKFLDDARQRRSEATEKPFEWNTPTYDDRIDPPGWMTEEDVEKAKREGLLHDIAEDLDVPPEVVTYADLMAAATPSAETGGLSPEWITEVQAEAEALRERIENGEFDDRGLTPGEILQRLLPDLLPGWSAESDASPTPSSEEE